jgi:hypothetical protein
MVLFAFPSKGMRLLRVLAVLGDVAVITYEALVFGRSRVAIGRHGPVHRRKQRFNQRPAWAFSPARADRCKFLQAGE